MIGAEASVDGLGFELIQPVSGPSIYQEFLDAHGGEGVQHIACMKHSEQGQHSDAGALAVSMARRGHLMSGRIGDSIEFYYLDTAPMLKFVLESGSGHAIDPFADVPTVTLVPGDRWLRFCDAGPGRRRRSHNAGRSIFT